eukprot:365535-Chlamydomonas_euryale.AAC.78
MGASSRNSWTVWTAHLLDGRLHCHLQTPQGHRNLAAARSRSRALRAHVPRGSTVILTFKRHVQEIGCREGQGWLEGPAGQLG